MLLPNAAAAIVNDAKLLDYALDPNHPRGRHKARVFAAALGITRANAHLLRQALLDAAATQPAKATGPNAFGDRYRIDFVMRGPGGTATVRSTWIVLKTSPAPQLISCFVI